MKRGKNAHVQDHRLQTWQESKLGSNLNLNSNEHGNTFSKQNFYRTEFVCSFFFIWKIKSNLGLEFRSAIRNKIDSHARFHSILGDGGCGQASEGEKNRVHKFFSRHQFAHRHFAMFIPIRFHFELCMAMRMLIPNTKQQTNARNMYNTHITHYHKLQHYYSGRH